MHISFLLGNLPFLFEHGGNDHASVREVFVFANWERTRIAGIIRGILALHVVTCLLSRILLRPVLCFRGARRSVMMFCCVFAASRHLARPFSALGLFWALSGQFFLFFFVSLAEILGFWEACHALFKHRGSIRAHICASWRRQTTNLAANRVTKSVFPHPPWSVFELFFGTFLYSSE